jgi:hypothetical protein
MATPSNGEETISTPLVEAEVDERATLASNEDVEGSVNESRSVALVVTFRVTRVIGSASLAGAGAFPRCAWVTRALDTEARRAKTRAAVVSAEGRVSDAALSSVGMLRSVTSA